MPTTCPNCGADSSGRFCSTCGTNLEASSTCSSCGHVPPAGATFCNMCGTDLRAVKPSAPPLAAADAGGQSAGDGPNSLPWIITGIALLALLGVILLPRLRQDPVQSAPTFAAEAPAAGDPRAVDLASMTPREAADRLFNRVMQAVANADSAQAQMFLPMAIAAYQQVEDLDQDGLYHLAVLHLVNEDPAAARREAGTILSRDPDHLFGLFTAGQAEEALGRPEEARAFFARFLERYEAERARTLPEYTEHDRAFPAMLEEARRVAG